MPINDSNALTLAHQVRTYTMEAAGFTDTVDVFYIAQMMHKFMDYVNHQREVSSGIEHLFFICTVVFVCSDIKFRGLVLQLLEVLVEMGSNLMHVDDQILSRAQREERACSSIVYSLETLAWPQLHPNAQDLSMVGHALKAWYKNNN